MFGHLSIGGIEIGFIAAGPGDGISQVVRGEDLGDPLEEFESMNMGLNPGAEILAEGGLGKGVAARSQGGHKDLGLMDLAGFGIRDPHGLPGIVDKELFSGPVFLTEAGVEFFGPLTVDAAELAVLISLRVLLLVFMPQKLKRHTLGSLSRGVAGMRRNMQLASLALDRGIIIMS